MKSCRAIARLRRIGRSRDSGGSAGSFDVIEGYVTGAGEASAEGGAGGAGGAGGVGGVSGGNGGGSSDGLGGDGGGGSGAGEDVTAGGIPMLRISSAPY